MRARLTGAQLFWLTHVGLALWAVIVMSVAVVMEDAGWVCIFFAPVLLLKFLEA